MKKDKMTAILLSGGKSKRMGKSKQMLSYNGVYLIDTIIANLSKHFNEIIIVSNERGFLNKRYKNFTNKILIVGDIVKDMGPCGGLLSGLTYSTNKDNLLLACDMPYFSDDYLAYLKKKPYYKALVYEGKSGLEPFFGLYDKNLIEDIKIYLSKGKRSLHGFLKEISPTIISRKDLSYIEDLDEIFTNLNYPEDWQKYLEENIYGCD